MVERNGATSAPLVRSVRQLEHELISLPAQVPDFTGREAETAALEAALVRGSGPVAITAIAGLGGVGKTALAIETAHRVTDRFPDGVLFISLGSGSQEPVTPAMAMEQVIRLVAPTARVPSEPEDLASTYRQLLAGKRVLLIFDDARDTAQVCDLVPPPPAAVLVTSRARTILPEATQVNLDTLTLDEAVALLREILPEERAVSADELKALADLCGRLPLALRVAGTFLATHPAWSVADYLSALEKTQLSMLLRAGEDDAATSLRAALAFGLEQLAREDAALLERLRRLAVFSAGFLPDAAAAVWDVSEAEARGALDALSDRSLILHKSGTGRYRLHDLFRDLIADGLGEAAQEEAAARHAQHYVRVLAKGEGLYLAGGERLLEGLTLFDTERANIEAGQVWAAMRLYTNACAARLAYDYTDVGAHVLALRLSPDERVRWLEAAVEGCRRVGHRLGEASALGNLGLAWHQLGKPREAIVRFEEQLAIARELNDRRGEASALGNLGLTSADLGDLRRAIALFEEQLAIVRVIGDRRGEANALSNLGNAAFSRGDLIRAVKIYEEAIDIARHIGDRVHEGRNLGNLGNAYYAFGEIRAALDCYDQQLSLSRILDDRRGEGNAFWNSALALEDLGERDKAVANAQAALAVRRQLEDPNTAKIEVWLRERGVDPDVA